jgi:hypothetical protein
MTDKPVRIPSELSVMLRGVDIGKLLHEVAEIDRIRRRDSLPRFPQRMDLDVRNADAIVQIYADYHSAMKKYLEGSQ